MMMMMMIMEEENEMRSLRSRRQKSSISSSSSSCCFNIINGGTSTSQQHRRRASLDASSTSSSFSSCASPTSSPRPPSFPDKCRNFISRMGGGRHRRHSSADFSYDPLSYALNFNDNVDPDDALNFTARLPASPPPIMRLDHHHHLPKSPAPAPSSELRRGFQALEDSIKGNKEED